MVFFTSIDAGECTFFGEQRPYRIITPEITSLPDSALIHSSIRDDRIHQINVLWRPKIRSG